MSESVVNVSINDNDNLLNELTIDNLNIIKKRLKKEWPLSICAYYFIENYQRWKENDLNTSVIFYSYYVNTFIGYLPDQNYIVIYTCDLKNNHVSLKNLFDCKKINWIDGPTFGAMQIFHRLEILNEIKARNLTVDWEVLSTCLFMSKDDALKLEINIPLDLNVRPLTSDDSEIVNNLWPYNFDGSYKFINDMITNNGGSMLINKYDNKIMAWALQNNYGAVGIVQTLNEFRRNGYGKLMSKIICKKIANNNMDCCAVISDGNFSETMLKNIGFHEISKITWIKIK